jgi:hypothetical protein
MADFDHNGLLARAASEHHTPLGFRRRGRSRTWVRDAGWWVLLVEFQASQFSRGSYLNVGPMWLWKPGPRRLHPDSFARVEGVGFTDAADPEGFASAVAELAQLAVDESTAILSTVKSPRHAAPWIEDARHRPSWPDLNGGIAHGLAGEWEQATALMTSLSVRAEAFTEPSELAAWGRELIGKVGTEAFVERVIACIEARRAGLGLNERPIAFESSEA